MRHSVAWGVPVVALAAAGIAIYTPAGQTRFPAGSVSLALFLGGLVGLSGWIWFLHLGFPTGARRLSARLTARPAVGDVAALLLISLAALVALDAVRAFSAPGAALAAGVWLLLAAAVAAALPNARELERNFALALTLCALGFVALEIVFRAVLMRWEVPRSEAAFARQIASTWPHAVAVEKAVGTYRIVGLADSFGMAGDRENYHYQLEDRLRAAGHAVEVVNFSVGGFSPRDELDMLTRHGPRYAPDLVLHGFFLGNDYLLEDGNYVSCRGVPIRLAEGWAGYLPRNFVFPVWVQRLAVARAWHRQRERAIQQGADINDRLNVEAFKERLRPNFFLSRVPPNPVIRWQETLELVDQIAAAARSMGADYLLLIHPHQLMVHDALRDAAAAYNGYRLEEYDFDYPRRLLLEHAAARGYRVYDPLPAMRAHPVPEEWYAPGDIHYATPTNAWLADRLAEVIAPLLDHKR